MFILFSILGASISYVQCSLAHLPSSVFVVIVVVFFSTSLDISFKSFKNLRLQQIWTRIISFFSDWVYVFVCVCVFTLLVVRCLFGHFIYFICVSKIDETKKCTAEQLSQEKWIEYKTKNSYMVSLATIFFSDDSLVVKPNKIYIRINELINVAYTPVKKKENY